jgi:Domain of unknown function (DUF4062)/Protein kinase domain
MRVFVASTLSDLVDYRAAATRAILLAGKIPEDMLYWPSEASEPLEVSLRRLRASHVLVLILAHSYGEVTDESGASVTEHEYEAAVAAGMKVLAFFADPDHPWPPRFVERDPEKLGRLRDFQKRVEQHVTRSLFTTPESLEVSISHALGALVTNEHEPGPSNPTPRQRLREVERPEILHYSPDALVKIGDAPDGAPLLLNIARALPVDDAVASVASLLRVPLDAPLLESLTSEMSQRARSLAITDHTHQVTTPAGDVAKIYMTNTTLVELAAPSLFQSMLASDDRVSSLWDGGTISSGRRETPEHVSAIESLGGSNRFLCVALDAPSTAWTGGWSGEKESKRVQVFRQFIEEGLERLGNVSFILKLEHDRSPLLETEKVTDFHECWKELLTSRNESELARLRTRVQIPRAAIVCFLLEVMDEVSELHRLGRIHGDLKPSNILVNRCGGALIDEVGMAVDEISPTVSLGWSPPEQLMREPLSYAADVYPLGEMIRRVLEAEALGRQVSYRMPGGSVVQVCESPTIYLEPESDVVPAAGRDDWCEVVERGLVARPSERWESVGAMADALRLAMERAPISGSVEVAFPWGDKPEVVRTEEGDTRVAWILSAPGDASALRRRFWGR